MKRSSSVTLSVPGHYNVLNAATTYAVARALGATDADVRLELSAYGGTYRRFQLIGTVDDVRVYDDYAHHPTEVSAVLRAARPQARVLMVSLPDVYRVWELGHTNSFAVKVWKSGVCPNLLTNPTSTAAADVARRTAFANQIVAYNTQLKDACARYGARCRYSNIANFAFDLNMLSAIDFFHPNASGQNALALVQFRAIPITRNIRQAVRVRTVRPRAAAPATQREQ